MESVRISRPKAAVASSSKRRNAGHDVVALEDGLRMAQESHGREQSRTYRAVPFVRRPSHRPLQSTAEASTRRMCRAELGRSSAVGGGAHCEAGCYCVTASGSTRLTSRIETDYRPLQGFVALFVLVLFISPMVSRTLTQPKRKQVSKGNQSVSKRFLL